MPVTLVRTRSASAARRTSVGVCAFLAACVAALLPGSAIQGQSASFRSVDGNLDGRLGTAELARAFGQDGAQTLLSYFDHNGDGFLTVLEIRGGVVRRAGEDGNDRGSGAGSGSTDGGSAADDGGYDGVDGGGGGDDGNEGHDGDDD